MKMSKTSEKKWRQQEWNESWASSIDILERLKINNIKKKKLIELLEQSTKKASKKK